MANEYMSMDTEFKYMYIGTEGTCMDNITMQSPEGNNGTLFSAFVFGVCNHACATCKRALNPMHKFKCMPTNVFVTKLGQISAHSDSCTHDPSFYVRADSLFGWDLFFFSFFKYLV